MSARASCLTTVAIAFGLVATGARAEEAPLTLQQAIDLALAKNERALKAPARVDAAVGGVDRARSAFLPTLTASGNGTWSSIADRNGRNFAGDGTLTLNQPLVNPSAFPLYSQARHTLESERWGAVEDLRVLAFDTANAFLTALSTRAAAGRGAAAASCAPRPTGRLRGARAGGAHQHQRRHARVAGGGDRAAQVATAQGNLQRAYLQLAYLVGQPVTGRAASRPSARPATRATARGAPTRSRAAPRIAAPT